MRFASTSTNPIGRLNSLLLLMITLPRSPHHHNSILVHGQPKNITVTRTVDVSNTDYLPFPTDLETFPSVLPHTTATKNYPIIPSGYFTDPAYQDPSRYPKPTHNRPPYPYPNASHTDYYSVYPTPSNTNTSHTFWVKPTAIPTYTKTHGYTYDDDGNYEDDDHYYYDHDDHGYEYKPRTTITRCDYGNRYGHGRDYAPTGECHDYHHHPKPTENVDYREDDFDHEYKYGEGDRYENEYGDKYKHGDEDSESESDDDDESEEGDEEEDDEDEEKEEEEEKYDDDKEYKNDRGKKCHRKGHKKSGLCWKKKNKDNKWPKDDGEDDDKGHKDYGNNKEDKESGPKSGYEDGGDYKGDENTDDYDHDHSTSCTHDSAPTGEATPGPIHDGDPESEYDRGDGHNHEDEHDHEDPSPSKDEIECTEFFGPIKPTEDTKNPYNPTSDSTQTSISPSTTATTTVRITLTIPVSKTFITRTTTTTIQLPEKNLQMSSSIYTDHDVTISGTSTKTTSKPSSTSTQLKMPVYSAGATRITVARPVGGDAGQWGIVQLAGFGMLVVGLGIGF